MNNIQKQCLVALALILRAAALQVEVFLDDMIDQRGRRNRRWWVRPINRQRQQKGNYDNLFREMKETDHEEFFEFTRMLPQKFDQLLEMVKPHLVFRSRRKPLPTELRLALTLSYLAHGDSVRSKSWNFRIGRSTAHKVIPEVCNAIWKALQPTYLPELSRAQWAKVAEGYQEQWQFPNCVGAVDGKHVTIKAPPNSEAKNYCYKKYFSMLMLAACDAHYRFTWVDIGHIGSLSDCSVWTNSDFGRLLDEGAVDLPPPKVLPGTNIKTNHAFIGDEAFPLKKYMMRPYNKDLTDSARVFNYRLSQARRTIENAFGILVSRWQILSKRICCKEDNVTSLLQAMVCLHNFIMSENGQQGLMYCPPDLIDQEDSDHNLIEGQWRSLGGHGELHDVTRLGANNAQMTATAQRNTLRDYFVSPAGEVEWQYACAFRGLVVNAPNDVLYEADDESND